MSSVTSESSVSSDDRASGGSHGKHGSYGTYEIFRDPWGIPHLRASDNLTLAYAQGRVTAFDRAWQLEVERHRAQGSSAAFLGADSVAWDRFARQSRLDDTARRCHEALDAETAAWVGAYVDGVNDGLAAGAARDERFARTGLVPARWEPWVPLSVWTATHVLFAGFATKLWRERVARALGDEAVTLFATDGPGTAGSNGWLVPGDRTSSGSAIIAGDPHRFIEDPGVYQQIRLSCPDYDVLGLAVPGVPGLGHFGHTGTAAWAITNAMADYQDLYTEQLRGEGPGLKALDPDGVWQPVARHTETIAVADGEDVEVEVLETSRGPVIVNEGGQTLSLHYPPRVRRDLGFAALPALLRARTVADIDRALDGWAEPVNVVHAADSAGGLLHRVAGAVPLRDGANRLRPVPAWDRRHDWQGWAETPAEPVQGFAVMANARGIASPSAWSSRPRTAPTASASCSAVPRTGPRRRWPACTRTRTWPPPSRCSPCCPRSTGCPPPRRPCGPGCRPGTGTWRPTAPRPPSSRPSGPRPYAASPPIPSSRNWPAPPPARRCSTRGCTWSPGSATPSKACSPPHSSPVSTAPRTSAPPSRRRPRPAPPTRPGPRSTASPPGRRCRTRRPSGRAWAATTTA